MSFQSAIPYFNHAITQRPKRANERRINEVCCYYLAQALYRGGRIEEAKKYLNLGKKSLLPDSKYFGRYKELSSEFLADRSKGKLLRVEANRGFGIIEMEGGSGQTVSLHISEFLLKVSNEEFEKMQGSTLSFIVEKTEKGMVAKKAVLLTE